MAKIEDVRLWLMMEGIGHILASSRSGYQWTACGIWTNLNDRKTEVPPRKCRKCMAALKKATLIPGK